MDHSTRSRRPMVAICSAVLVVAVLAWAGGTSSSTATAAGTVPVQLTGTVVPAQVTVRDLGEDAPGAVPVLVSLDVELGADGVAGTSSERSRLADASVSAGRAVLAAGGDPGPPARSLPVMSAVLPAGAATQVVGDPAVASVAPDRVYRVDELVDAGLVGPAQGTGPEQESLRATGAQHLWGGAVDGSGYSVAVLDTGVLTSHAAFEGRVTGRACFSTEWGTTSHSTCPAPGSSGGMVGEPCAVSGCDHGTHVAGIAVGEVRPVPGMAGETVGGMAPGAGLVTVQIFSDVGGSPGAWGADIVAALQWVYDNRVGLGIASVNMSVGGSSVDSRCDDDDVGADAAGTVVRNLSAAGVVVAAASGNSGSRTSVSHPGCLNGLVTVAATSGAAWDTVTTYSNMSAEVEVAAPGSGILSAGTASTSAYVTKSGTSMATPHVAGAAALWREANPRATGTSGFLATVAGAPVTCGAGDSCQSVPRLWVGDVAEAAPGTGSTLPTTTVPTTTTTVPYPSTSTTTTTTTTTVPTTTTTLPRPNRTPWMNLDQVAVVPGRKLSLSGWAFDWDGPVPAVLVVVDGVPRGLTAPSYDRPDVWNFFSRTPPLRSGWQWSSGAMAKGRHNVCVQVRDANQVGAVPAGWTSTQCRTVTVK